MSVVYNQHVYSSVFIGQTGHTHAKAAAAADDETPMAIDCSACEPFLVKEGWVYAEENVPLTDRQARDQERTEREGNLAVKQVAEALAATAAEAIVAGTAAKRAAGSTVAKKATRRKTARVAE